MFPHPELADTDGLLAMGGDLSPQRLLLAYRYGIFPWYNEGPILWWSPDPRCVLWPEELKVSKSMRSYLRKTELRVTINQDFKQVITNCQVTPRKDQNGTWITEAMSDAYQLLHDLGFAHSVEVWSGSELVAGLYGIALGKVFFGESMFTHVSNGSKLAFIRFVHFLEQEGFRLIDCQQNTEHLRSLGAVTIPRTEFLQILRQNNRLPEPYRDWRSEFIPNIVHYAKNNQSGAKGS